MAAARPAVTNGPARSAGPSGDRSVALGERAGVDELLGDVDELAVAVLADAAQPLEGFVGPDPVTLDEDPDGGTDGAAVAQRELEVLCAVVRACGLDGDGRVLCDEHG